jgi:hypothetical protein
MRSLLGAASIEVLDEANWSGRARRLFADADTPEDLHRLGIAAAQ